MPTVHWLTSKANHSECVVTVEGRGFNPAVRCPLYFLLRGFNP